MEYGIYNRVLTSRNNIILGVKGECLDLIGYSESELIGKTLVEVGKLLRVDSQVDLEDIEDDTRIFIFTKDLNPIEGRISCEIMDNGEEKVFSFEKDPLQSANQSFKLASQLGSIRGDAVVIIDFDNLVVINNNEKHLDFHKAPYNEKKHTIGKSIMEILPKDLHSLFNKMKNHIINTGNPFQVKEYKLDLKSLGESYWNISMVPIEENGKNRYLLIQLSNKTEKVLNRQGLKQTIEELETLVENISDEIIIFDREFNIALCSKNLEGNLMIKDSSFESFKNMYDFKSNTILFDEDNQLIPYEELPFKKVYRGENISKVFIKAMNEGNAVYMEVSGYSIYDKDGNFSCGVLIFKDIQDRIEKEETRLIKTQKEILTKVVESMNLEYVRCTYPELKIISMNDKAVDRLKKINNEIKSDNTLIGKSAFDLYPIDLKKKMKAFKSHLMGKGECSYVDYQKYIIDGEERFFKIINEPILGLDNKVIEIMFITTDITEEVQKRNKLEETLEIQNQIFTTISHELKTPLNVIFSAAQLIERDLQRERGHFDKDDISQKISIIKQNCYRFTKLINNIIDLSRMESGFYKLKFSNENIVEIIENIVDSVSSYVENAGLRIIFDTDIEEKVMAIDVDKMERVMLNLISNAVKFSPKGETIYINIEDKGDTVRVLVRDCGAGIGPDHLNTIFDRYKKVDNTLYKNSEGSGLGLSLVDMIAKSVGAKISVESELGKGSIFTIEIPVNILAEVEVREVIENEASRKEQLNIEFSDI